MHVPVGHVQDPNDAGGQPDLAELLGVEVLFALRRAVNQRDQLIGLGVVAEERLRLLEADLDRCNSKRVHHGAHQGEHRHHRGHVAFEHPADL